ncbi:MAG: NAD(P)(+) transhydrogenase (Re/Si-specific) subunit beta [Candidatus Caldipriscus sp.]
MNHIITGTYFLAVLLFIFGLKLLSSPTTARKGNLIAGVGMLLAILITFPLIYLQYNQDPNFAKKFGFMVLAILLGSLIGWVSAKKVSITDMPQMVALFNGMGGGAAWAIGCLEILRGHGDFALKVLAALALIIGAISFSGSGGAFVKLQGWIGDRPITFPGQHILNAILLLATFILGFIIFWNIAYLDSFNVFLFYLFFIFFNVLPFILGFLITLPIGGADMPVVISLFNAMTGLAVAFDGFAIQNYTLIVSGTIVGASGTLLTFLMAKAMNRSITNILFGAMGKIVGGEAKDRVMKEISAEDAAATLAYANKVIIVPGFGLAAAQSQHKIKELMDELESRGVEVKFAIHPVAGRMPGHMNVLLAEADIPYDKLYDLEEINEEFSTADVALIVGANDVVNPSAENDPNSPIYGMPILKAYNAKNVFVIKRGRGRGFAGIDNELFYLDKTFMLFGDARDVISKLVQAIKRF